MSILDEKDKDTIEATEELTPDEIDSRDEMTTDAPISELPSSESSSSESLITEFPSSESLTLEDLELDISEPSMTFTATLHFEFSDILNAIEHLTPEPEAAEPAEAVADEVDSESIEPAYEAAEPETEMESGPEVEEVEIETENETELDSDPELGLEFEPEPEPEFESETDSNPGHESELQPEPEPEAPASEPAKPERKLFSGLRGKDTGTRRLVITDIILLVVIVASIIGGLAAANSLVDKANAANEAKIAEKQANVKEVNLTESLYNMAANKVVDDVAVPTYTLDQLYALDLREKTGFTAKDLEIITRKGLVGCEEAFVKAEQTYGVNSIFLVSIASLESAHGTMMFRPNNMFGYGRTGFSSKEECIMTVAKGLGTRYLPPGGSLYGGSPTLKGVNKRYAANPQWYYKVGKYMQGYYAELAAAKNGALDKFE